MHVRARLLAATLVTSIVLAVPLSPPAAGAEKICGGRGRPPCTILRPPARAAAVEERSPLGPECIVAVGGFASTNGDRAFDALLEWSDADLRFQTYHFGYDDREGHPYDSTGPIDESATAFASLIGSLKGSCSDVHVVTHSMGGAVVDRAFAKGLSGVRTYIALSGPHNGASVARIVAPYLAGDPLLAAEVHAILRDGPDPTTRAGRDLALVGPPHRTIRDATTLRLRLATDAFVLRRDTLDRRVETREYMPELEWDQIDGHGGSLDNAEVRDAVWSTILTTQPAPDLRSPRERLIADAVSREVERDATALYAGATGVTAVDPGARLVLGAAAIAATVARAVATVADDSPSPRPLP